MRKTFSMGFSRWMLFAVLAFGFGALSLSCEKHSYGERNESIDIYLSPDDEEPWTGAVSVNADGGTVRLYVKSNVDYQASWEDSSETSPWVKIVGDEEDAATGFRVLELKLSPRSRSECYYTRRTGMLILSAKDASLNFNKIITVNQGYVARVSQDFSNFKYGNADPRITGGETPISNWTAAQKNYGYSSTVIEGEDMAYCYAKNGYLILGDDKGHGADLISPIKTELRSDSLLVVSFRALAYTDWITGEKDAGKIRLDVLGGGVIRDFEEDEVTSIEFEVGNMDIASEKFPKNMWIGSDYMVFISSSEHNPISGNTQIRIVAGDMSGSSAKCNRIYFDNFYIRRFVDTEVDYFEANGGSGPDRILGPVIAGEDNE